MSISVLTPSRVAIATALAAGGLALTASHAGAFAFPSVGSDGRLNITGGSGVERVALKASSFPLPTVDVDINDDGVYEFQFPVSLIKGIDVNLKGGDDRFRVDESGGAFPMAVAVDGGPGADKISGGTQGDKLTGGDGNDEIDGNGGADSAVMGAGDDVFVWDPGDGSDVVEGEAGRDELRFNGTDNPEAFAAAANGSRIRFTRTQGNIAMDLGGIEVLHTNPRGGVDTMDVGDLSGTEVTDVDTDLGNDSFTDTVTADGTKEPDDVGLDGNLSKTTVTGLRWRVNATNAGASDNMVVRLLGQNDKFDGAGYPAGGMEPGIQGGPGNDTLLGTPGRDAIDGGEGDDFLDGQQAGDQVNMGTGNDVAQWDPGDGSDTVEGQGGDDRLEFFGNDQGENIEVSRAPNNRVILTRDIGGIHMDLNGIGRLGLTPRGGADTITINDLLLTGLADIRTEMVPDNAIDRLVLNGTAGDDAWSLSGSNGSVDFSGPTGSTHGGMRFVDPTDTITVNGLAGTDTLDTSGLTAGTIGVTFNQ